MGLGSVAPPADEYSALIPLLKQWYQRRVPTLSGSVELKIKPGMQSGQKMRLKGKGMPGPTAGDQFVEIMIQTPPADNKAAKEFYQGMKAQFDFNPRPF